jgi:glyoxylase-like metal-dependent hydrolase (beta-lactamase superfamily II)
MSTANADVTQPIALGAAKKHQTRWEAGAVTIDRVVESEYARLSPFELLPQLTPELLEANLDWLAPRFLDAESKLLVINMQGFVVRSEGRIILVDTCVGDCKERARKDLSGRGWNWLDRLREVGVTPEEVDIVVCTHFHVDHVGWNTRLQDGRWVPTFPNARYLFTHEEYDFWRSEAGRPGLSRTGDYMVDSVMPVVEAGLVDFVPMNHIIDQNVRLTPIPGHTPGLVAVNVYAGGQRVILPGDVLHTPLQCKYPNWSTRFCADPDQSRVTRVSFMASCAGTKTLVMPTHFPSPSAGYFERDGDVFRFRYAE